MYIGRCTISEMCYACFIGLSRLGAECRLQEMEEMLTKRTEMLVATQDFVISMGVCLEQ